MFIVIIITQAFRAKYLREGEKQKKKQKESGKVIEGGCYHTHTGIHTHSHNHIPIHIHTTAPKHIQTHTDTHIYTRVYITRSLRHLALRQPPNCQPSRLVNLVYRNPSPSDASSRVKNCFNFTLKAAVEMRPPSGFRYRVVGSAFHAPTAST